MLQGKGYCILLVADDGITELPVSETKVYQKQSGSCPTLPHALVLHRPAVPLAGRAAPGADPTDTLIVWTEPSNGQELSLSFRENVYRERFL